MSDDDIEEDETTKPPKKSSKGIRDAAVVDLAIQGKNVNEISHEMGIHRTTVGRILSSKETKEIIESLKARITNLGSKAVDTLDAALDARSIDMTNGAKVAISILKSLKVISEKLDIEHSFPKPTIITRPNGEVVTLGTKNPDEEKAS